MAIRLKRMLKADFLRMYASNLVYIFIGISLIVPILILVMTTMNSGEESSFMFTNVWQMIGSIPNESNSTTSAASAMDMSSMMNINMLLFLVGILSCIFVANDFRSGYVKNYFVIRKNRTDYVLSKIIVLSSASCFIYLAFLVGSILGGKFASLSFDMEGFNVYNIFMSMVSKILLSVVFISIFVVMSVLAKDKLWLSIILSLGAGMLLFMMVPSITPLTSGMMNFILTFAGAIIFSISLSLLGNFILTKFRTI